MKRALTTLMLSTAIAAVIAPAAMAQDGDNPFLRGRYTSVTERDQPEVDPLPVRAGAFTIDASLGARAEYSDNIFAEPNNEDDDTVIRINPSVDVRSNWSVHEIAAGFDVDHEEYVSNDDESTTDYNLYLNGRVDATRNLLFRAGVNGGKVTEERYAAASQITNERASYTQVGGFGSAEYRQDRISLRGTVGVNEQEFEQVAQRLRDNEATYVDARVSYAVSPDVAVFVEANQTEQDYSFSNRDGTRTSYGAGVNFELAAPFRGEVAVGYFEDDRDALVYEDIDGVSVAGLVEWFPTQLTTVTFHANRGVVDPGLVNSATALSTNFGARVDHELYRNILLFGLLRSETLEYEGTAFDREDDAIAAAVGAAWKLNRNAHLEAAYSIRNQDSSGINAGPDIDQNTISVGIRVFP